MAAHLSALVAVAGLPFGHVLGLLVVYLIKAHESEFVAEHARASLNYQITVSILGIVGIIAAVGVMLGFVATSSGQQMAETNGVSFAVLWIAIAIAVLLILLLSIVFIIAGTVAASHGRPYNYPFAIRFLR
jgi:hypothetical protein